MEESRIFRMKNGKLPDEIGTPHNYSATEFNWIPFLGNNPSDEKPALYTGRFKFTDGVIELEAKRSGGKLHMTCLADEKHNRAIFECVERLVAAIFDGTARKISEAQPDDSEIMKLKKEIEQLEKDNEEHIKTLKQLKSIMK